MKHVRSILFAAALLAFTAPGVSHGQGASAGPRIVLEEEEIILLENGVEQQRIIVSKTSDERERIMSGVRERVWEKLGVSSDAEMNDKHLTSKYNEEIRRRVRVKALVPPKLKFVDASGNVIKEIIVNSSVQRQIKKTHARLKSPRLIKESVTRHVAVSMNRTRALVAESITDQIIPETEEEKKLIGDTDADFLGIRTVVAMYDVRGTTLWEIQLPANMLAYSGMQIAGDDGVAAFIQAYVMGGLDHSQPIEQLRVFDSRGKEVLSFPNERMHFIYMRRIVISSPSGRYVSVVGVPGESGAEVKTAFFDVKNGKRWIVNEDYYVKLLKDDGTCEVLYASKRKKEAKNLNLKSHLGE